MIIKMSSKIIFKAVLVSLNLYFFKIEPGMPLLVGGDEFPFFFCYGAGSDVFLAWKTSKHFFLKARKTSDLSLSSLSLYLNIYIYIKTLYRGHSKGKKMLVLVKLWCISCMEYCVNFIHALKPLKIPVLLDCILTPYKVVVESQKDLVSCSSNSCTTTKFDVVLSLYNLHLLVLLATLETKD